MSSQIGKKFNYLTIFLLSRSNTDAPILTQHKYARQQMLGSYRAENRSAAQQRFPFRETDSIH